MTPDEIEKDIIWKKLHGDFSKERLRDQFQFTAVGDESMFTIRKPDVRDYSMFLYIDSDQMPAHEYTLHEVAGYVTVILDSPPTANSNIQVNIVY